MIAHIRYRSVVLQGLVACVSFFFLAGVAYYEDMLITMGLLALSGVLAFMQAYYYSKEYKSIVRSEHASDDMMHLERRRAVLEATRLGLGSEDDKP